uniref:RING-type domain-containing protein n=1 Tax=Caenorhabditis tropicalis TaxID=1561998 RepID=A0A1I7TRN4_9PELO
MAPSSSNKREERLEKRTVEKLGEEEEKDRKEREQIEREIREMERTLAEFDRGTQAIAQHDQSSLRMKTCRKCQRPYNGQRYFPVALECGHTECNRCRFEDNRQISRCAECRKLSIILRGDRIYKNIMISKSVEK